MKSDGKLNRLEIYNNRVEEFSYDVWGRRRDPSTWQLLAFGTNPSSLISRGYTQHEHIDTLGIINMNGRLYDPLLGRMLSPDILVQDPTSTQSLNRYSYVINNPLKYIDPSGYIGGIFYLINGIFSLVSMTSYTHNISEVTCTAWAPRQYSMTILCLSDRWSLDGGGSSGGIFGDGGGGNGGGNYYDQNNSTGQRSPYVGLGDGPGRYGADPIPYVNNDPVISKTPNGGGNVSNNEGLKVNKFQPFNVGQNPDDQKNGGVKISLSYTSNKVNSNCRWVQTIYSNYNKHSHGGPYTYQDCTRDKDPNAPIWYPMTHWYNSQIYGNKITFYDEPSRPDDGWFQAVVSLYDTKSYKCLYSFRYGFYVINNVTYPILIEVLNH